MNISSIKKMRRDLCRAVGHEYINFICSRCKTKPFRYILSEPIFVGKMPIRKDVGYISYTSKMMVYDGKNWIEC
jgi:hypothetical protein